MNTRGNMRVRWIDAALGASAAGLGVLTLALSLGGGGVFAARAEAADGAASSSERVGEYEVQTLNIGNEDLVMVLDGRGEELFIYKPDQEQRPELLQRVSLPRLFLEARGRARGTP